MSLLLVGLLHLVSSTSKEKDPFCNCDSAARQCRCIGWQVDHIPRHLSSSLTRITIDHSALTTIGALDFEKYPRLVDMNLANNGLEEVPSLVKAATFDAVFHGATDLSGNKIKALSKSENKFGVDLIALALDNNPLSNVHPLAFSRLAILNQLDLSFTRITVLPTEGLQKLEQIVLRGVHSLKRLPAVFVFKNLRIARLTYPHHCCYFLNVRKAVTADLEECVEQRLSKRYALWGSFKVENESTPKPRKQISRSALKIRGRFHEEPFARPTIVAANSECIPEQLMESLEMVQCSPEPDALNPCEDMAGHTFVRLFMWLAWILAIVGNIGVLALFAWLANAGRRVGVSGFLVSNLAFADFCTGLYLAILAVQDARTAGRYCSYAVDWQSGIGCRSAGFLAIFSSELSMFTTIAISIKVKRTQLTLRRIINSLWYDTRASFYGFTFEWRTAIILQCIAWFLSILLATLPLTNINTYSVTSVCLPLRTENDSDKVYLFTLLLLKLFAVGYVTFNYLHIYFMVSGAKLPAAHTQDWDMARKLTLLVCTNFVCWTPTVVIGLSSAVGQPLLDISTCKYFLVLAYPINATADPFLYAFSSSKLVQQARLSLTAMRSNLVDHFQRVRHCSYRSAGSSSTESTCSQVSFKRWLISSFSSRCPNRI
ncbi:follicle stimulating hormone receptor [Trichuris trichiura]|uniref:Follicle stimulating hormone receptor n=1 Tax=Trichuris trichiura TaxID=36087 RepID=A0A077Z4S5_TRITR|nr:follicle stimulating hormone receptor [Trichuris trichiura]